MRKHHNMMIGERTAEDLKINIGTAFPRKNEVFMEVRGRNLLTGLPKTLKVYSNEMLEAMAEPISNIVEAVHTVLEKTPPELAADIGDKGILMTGGGALLYGIDKLISKKTGIDVRIAENPIGAVAIGTGKALDWIHLLEDDLIDSDSIRVNNG